jgi:hypothetical protein
MNRLDLNDIPLPPRLSSVVDHAIKNARDGMPVARRGFHRRYLIAVAVGLVGLAVVCFSVPPVTAAIADFFSSLRGTSLENDSRTNIVENGFTAPAPAGSQSIATIHGYQLSLENYYLDADEIGLEFALSGPELDSPWDMVSLPNLALEITNASGVRQVWQGTDILDGAVLTRVGENRYDLVVVLGFRSPIDTTAKDMHLSFDGIQTFAPLAMEDEKALLKDSIAGPWVFDTRIDKKFAQAETVTYRVVDPEAALEHGIVVQSVEVRPSVTRIELAIDYSKNDLADEANVREASAPGFKHKIDFMNTDISLQAGEKIYGFGSSDIIQEEGDIVYCWREVGSMYFDSTATQLTLQITSPSMNSEVISIPLVRD